MARGHKPPSSQNRLSLPPHEQLAACNGPARRPLGLLHLTARSMQAETETSAQEADFPTHGTTLEEPMVLDASDSEAEAVRLWASQNSPSEEEDEDNAMHQNPCWWVCNGPWSAMHRTTQESAAAFEESGSINASLLQARCGCKIGLAALASWGANPANACRRNGCS